MKKKDVFVTTKIHPRHLGRKGMDLIETSLRNLQTDYIDLVLLHYSECWGNLCQRGEVVPGRGKRRWRELERLVKEFKVVRFIGVSNFNANDLEQLHTFAKVQPLVVQVRSDLFGARPKDDGCVREIRLAVRGVFLFRRPMVAIQNQSGVE